jgi:hypothetical protein
MPFSNVYAQVPVIDDATLSQATKTASNTAEIMSSNSEILQTVNRTLAAVTGNRSTSEIAGSALGSGFSIGSAPDFSSLLSGQMSWGNLGSYGNTAATILNGLNLVKTLSGQMESANLTRGDKAYQGLVNTATALTASSSARPHSRLFRGKSELPPTSRAPSIRIRKCRRRPRRPSTSSLAL